MKLTLTATEAMHLLRAVTEKAARHTQLTGETTGPLSKLCKKLKRQIHHDHRKRKQARANANGKPRQTP